MTQNKSKAVSFNTMVKLFMRQYDIPTRKDFTKLMTRMERIEKLIRQTRIQPKTTRTAATKLNSGAGVSNATTTVLNAIGKCKDGATITDIQKITGFGKKKLRNTVHRLFKLGKIRRIKRGVYTTLL